MKQRVPVPVQKNKELVLTKLPLDPQPPYILWFYRHMCRLGYKTYPNLEEAYFIGQYWLRVARRKYPERRYRFALGEPVYVALQLDTKRGIIRNKVPFLVLEEAQRRLKQWETREGKKGWNGNLVDSQLDIVVGYEWEWHQIN